MKHSIALLGALLCLSGQEWKHHELGAFNYRDNGETIYRLHHVIGTVRYEWNYDWADVYCDRLYTVPADNVIWMTQGEADRANSLLKGDHK